MAWTELTKNDSNWERLGIQISVTWGDLEGHTWADLEGYTWEQLSAIYGTPPTNKFTEISKNTSNWSEI